MGVGEGGGGEKSGGNSASTETQRRSREHGNGAEGGRSARDGRGEEGRREACTCRQTLKWKQSEPSERVLWILPQLPSAHPFRPSTRRKEGKLYSWIKFVFDRMAVEGIILRWEGVRKDEAIEFVTVACLLGGIMGRSLVFGRWAKFNS